MSTHIARGGRRRRVLHDEARAAAGAAAALSMSTSDGAEAPRYGELAGVEHHPQITDYVPRRKRAVLVALGGGVGIAAATAALQHAASDVATFVPGLTGEQLRGRLAGGVAAWTTAIAMLAIAGLSRLAFSLRRHRVNDVRGNYRVWKWVTGGALALSLNAIVGIHSIAASVAIALTGRSLTVGGAEWWLAPTGLMGAWLAWRLMHETAESRSSLAMFVAAILCYAVGAAGALGWAPAALGNWSHVLTTAVPIVGHALALAGMMWFARYVVLDVQGLIDHAPRPAKASRREAATPAADEATEPRHEAKPTIPLAPAAAKRREPAPAAAAPEPQWDEEADEDDDDAVRPLSKSERKRLRKQHRRAA
jgi:hypothetical protein